MLSIAHMRAGSSDYETMHLGREIVSQSPPRDQAGVWPGSQLLRWDPDQFSTRLHLKISRVSQLEAELDIVGVDTSVANAIRRVLIAEVPTVAVENVYIWNNTTLVQDEVLSQRLGLVPLRIDPKKVEFKGPGEEPTDLNTIVFSLVVKCERNPKAKRSETDPEKLYNNAHVYSSAFAWQQKGVQTDIFADDPPQPVFDDILLAKLRGNQEIILEMHCEKGIGKDHAKWSPVATASYRLLPTIDILTPILPELCDKFAACFPPGVIAVEEDSKGRKTARVADARKDTVSREVLRHPEFENSVRLGRKRDHFIFNLESVGQIPASDLVPQSLEILLSKITNLRNALAEL